MSNLDRDLYEFGEFRFDASSRVLWAGKDTVDVGPKALEVLAVLIERRGDLVERSEIIERVWADTFVEEGNLNHAISALRKSLGDPSFIKTIPRRGYRFTPPVRRLRADDQRRIVIEQRSVTNTLIEEDEDDEPLIPHPVSSAVANAAHSSRFALIGPALAGGVLVIFLAAGWYLNWTPSMKDKSELGSVNSLAVLKMRSFDQSNSNEELRVRITDALITKLASGSRFSVRPTDSVMRLADTEAVEAGRRLGVDAVLDGRVQEENGRLRVTLQLISVTTGEQLWAEQLDGRSNELLAFQDMISEKLLLTMGKPGSDLPKRPTENNEAYEAYLKGRYFWYKRDVKSLRKAIEYFTTAAELDPEFSEAYSGIADSQYLLVTYDAEVNTELLEKAKSNLKRALELKPNSVDALVTLGAIQMAYDWDWTGAEEAFKLAIVAEPNYAMAHIRYGILLVRIRRFEEAQAEFERALELDPLSLVAKMNLGMVLFCRKDFASAEVIFRNVLEVEGEVMGSHWMLARTLWQMGRKEEAVSEIASDLGNRGDEPLAGSVKEKLATSGANEAIRWLLDEWRIDRSATNPLLMAHLSVYIDDREMAVYWLEKSYEKRHPWITWIAAAPDFEVLRDMPRFQVLLRNLHLE